MRGSKVQGSEVQGSEVQGSKVQDSVVWGLGLRSSNYDPKGVFGFDPTSIYKDGNGIQIFMVVMMSACPGWVSVNLHLAVLVEVAE